MDVAITDAVTIAMESPSNDPPPHPITIQDDATISMVTNVDANAANALDPHSPNLAMSMSATPKRPLTSADHLVMLSRTSLLPAGISRDSALLAALRSITLELHAAEEDSDRASHRLRAAKELYHWTVSALSGRTGSDFLANHNDNDISNITTNNNTNSNTNNSTSAATLYLLSTRGEQLRKRGRKRKGEEHLIDNDYDPRLVPPLHGPLLPPLPSIHGGGGLTPHQVATHRERFYQKLCGTSASELHNYFPPSSSANLKNRVQLDQCVYIARHWDTGVPGRMDVMAFRREHKSFYTKMKLCSENIGRRTGHHLRYLAGGRMDDDDDHHGGNSRNMVFCRYGKNGESLMYIPLEDLYDAIFEIHSLKGHRGWQSCKKLANLKYANLPQEQIRTFIETCPICEGRRSSSSSFLAGDIGGSTGGDDWEEHSGIKIKIEEEQAEDMQVEEVQAIEEQVEEGSC